MAVKFIIDSASDILPSEAEALGIIHIPMNVRFGTTEYLDAVNLTHAEFYEKLVESDTLPATSQIPPAVFEEEIRKARADGDSVIVVTVSSKLSGTYQSACLAASGFGENVYVVDSENVSIGERLIIELGVRLRDAGLGAEEIVSEMNRQKSHIRVLALFDTLEFLKKGGRISSGVAFVGNVIGIKPVISIVNGEVALLGKARGSKQGNNLLRELVREVGGINFDKPFALAYSGMTDALLRKYISDSAELLEGHDGELPIHTVGCAIGTHAGPGAVAVAFFEKE